MFYHTLELHGKLDKSGKLIKKGKQVVLFRAYDGFALPLDVLKRIKSVELHYEGTVYRADVETFKKHGLAHTFEDPDTYRREEQLILPRRFFSYDS